jgi:glycosyltransferase involved in cell wall biosynthesis
MRFSVIMPVCLSPYEAEGIKSATNPEAKFIRAVNSFLMQTFTDAELIIIADGCLIAQQLYKKYHHDNIRFIFIDKQPLFSGKVRQAGIDIAQGEIITYLDHDDFIGEDHLKIINENFTGDWVYYNDYRIKGSEGAKLIFIERQVSPQLYYIGTSMLSHRKDLNVVWGDGYAHDWRMIERYLLPHQGTKIETPRYYVCHFHPIDL